MTSNCRNVKLPFLTTRCHYWGGWVDLPLDLPIRALTVEITYCHSWPLDATHGEVDMPVGLPIWSLTIEMWNCHSWPLDATTRGWVDLPLDLPIWPLTVEMWNCHSSPLDTSTGGRSATWSANMNSNIQITCYTCQIWALRAGICNCHLGVGRSWGCWGCQGDYTVQC